MSREKKKRLPKKTRRIIGLSVFGGIAAAVLIFWGLFYIRNIEVVGNTRYSQEEIQEMTITGFLDHNSVFLSFFRQRVDLEEVPFMESVEVEYLNRDSVRLFVTEKHPIGYVVQNGIRYYFDKDGLVLEAVHETEVNEPGGTSLAESSENAETGDSSQPDQTQRPSPSLADVPLVEGLSYDRAATGEILEVENASVFNTILALVRMMERDGLQADRIVFGEDLSVSLYYGEIQVELGTDTDLEEKMTRVSAILPELEGMSGVLHLEDFTEDTQNIVFSQN